MMSTMVHNSSPSTDRSRRHDLFERLGRTRAEAPAIHSLLRDRLVERLDGLKLDPGVILDLGSGWGHGALAMHARFPKARVIALDSSPAMLKRAKKNQGWWRHKFELILGDITHAPIQPHSVDLVFASGVLPYLDDPAVLLKTARSALKPGGLLLVSALGPDTLMHERQALALAPRTWLDVQTLGRLLTQAGFNEPVLDTDWVSMHYQSPSPLVDDLDALGWALDMTLDGALDDETFKKALGWSSATAWWESTWECLFATAFAPDEGQTIRGDDGAFASISIDQIGIRQRPG